ncbi:MAG: fibronectin type III domain-containing protein [Chromatiaceae bacterium]|nr:fibronectin type III domain-containing protein [Chromatiaceae bacterium]
MLTACLNICRLAFFVCAVLFNPAVQAATLTVTSSADAGAGSLRQTILEAAADDIIQFDEGMLITLTSGELLIDKKLTIDGVGHAVTVSGNNASRVFHVRAATVVLQNLTVTEGHADVGGGLLLEYSSGSPAATLTNVTFADNSASSNGGGLHNDYGSTATLTHVTFSGNSASYGGGLHNIGTAILANVTFSGNSASYGGGLHNHYGSTATLTHVTFSGNSASYGGGLYSTEQATLTNVTFSGNTASYGGGLLNLADIVTLTYVTFSGNTATSGGGIYSYSHIFLTNTLLAGNTGGNCSGPGEIHDFSKNLDDETSCNFGTYNGSLSNTVPLLGALGNYGGPTQTIPLLPGSPAIDAGAGTTGGCPATDQRGVTRPQGAACDIGAFESQGFTLAKTGGDLQSTAISTAFASALAVSVTAMVAGEPANGGQVTFTAPASGASATLSTNPVTIASGAASVTATANGTAGSYAVAASAKGAVTVSFGLTNQQTQTITFNNPGAQNFGTTPTLTATSDSQLPVTLSSSTTGVCTVNSAGVLTFVTAGTCTINADQAGNSDYWPATQVSRSFSVNAVPPGPPTGVTATAGDTAASVAFTAPGNTGGVGIVGYVVTASPADIVPVEGANSPLVVFGLTNGQSYTFTVAAVNSAGTGTPSAASNAVTPQAAQTITFTTTAPSATVGGPVYTPAAIASSGLPVSFALDPASSAVCTLTGAQVSFQAIGNCTINANQAGNNTFLAARRYNRPLR